MDRQRRRSPRHSATAIDTRVWLCSIRIYPNRRTFSNTCSPYDLSCYSTNIPRWASLAGFSRCLDSPYLRRIQNYCRHYDYSFDLALVGHLHCAPTHLIHHGDSAYLPLCTTSCCRRAYSSTHPRGSPLHGASIVSQKTRAYSPSYKLLLSG